MSFDGKVNKIEKKLDSKEKNIRTGECIFDFQKKNDKIVLLVVLGDVLAQIYKIKGKKYFMPMLYVRRLLLQDL